MRPGPPTPTPTVTVTSGRRGVDARYRRGVEAEVEVEQVVRTATSVLSGQLTAREGVTILATLARDAVPAARRLRQADAVRADTYHELVLAVGRELRRMEGTSAEPHLVRALTDDLSRVLRALE